MIRTKENGSGEECRAMMILSVWLISFCLAQIKDALKILVCINRHRNHSLRRDLDRAKSLMQPERVDISRLSSKVSHFLDELSSSATGPKR